MTLVRLTHLIKGDTHSLLDALSEREPSLIDDLTLLARQHSEWITYTSNVLNSTKIDDCDSGTPSDTPSEPAWMVDPPSDFAIPKGSTQISFPFKFPRAWPFFGFLLEFLHVHLLRKAQALYALYNELAENEDVDNDFDNEKTRSSVDDLCKSKDDSYGILSTIMECPDADDTEVKLTNFFDNNCLPSHQVDVWRRGLSLRTLKHFVVCKMLDMCAVFPNKFRDRSSNLSKLAIEGT
jgi:hypothetical protein